MRLSIAKITTYVVSGAAILALIGAMGGSWSTSQPAIAAPVTSPSSTDPSPPPAPSPPASPSPRPASSSTGSAAPPGSGAGSAAPAPPPSAPRAKGTLKRELAGKLNLNSATADQLLLLPTVGPAKAERIIVWRQKNGGFKRVADLRRVKGFGYKTFKRLEPFLAITGDSTLAFR
jgi:competence protein ComEA